jgi:hypothetical protein
MPNNIIGRSVPEPNHTLAPPQCESVWSSLCPVSAGQPFSLQEIWTDAEMVEEIHRSGPQEADYAALVNSVNSPASGQLNPKLSRYKVEDNLLYHGHHMAVPRNSRLHNQIIRSHHDSKLAGHPGRAKTLSLIQHLFTWPSIKQLVNRYVDGCNSCQRTKPCMQRPLGLLEPLPIPAGPWTNISYDLITDLPVSEGFNSILTVVDRLTKMVHFIPFSKTLNTKELARLMLDNVWKLHGTPKNIVLDRGSIFISQVTKELD